MQQAATYQQRSRELLAKAWTELDDDLGQASEKGWGAAAEMVKAVAEQRGLYHRTHRSLYEIVDALVDETGDAELAELFVTASGLHFNFYENQHNRTIVAAGIQAVERFVAKAEALLTSSS